MITFFEGRPGNYKTYAAVKLCLKYLGNGGVVGGNIPWVIPKVRLYLRDFYAWDLQDGQLIELEGHAIRLPWLHIPAGTREHPSLCVVDECGRFFNARDWASTGRDFLDFLALHRHQYTDVLLIDQHAENVDKQFRRLVALYHVFKNLRESTGGIIPIRTVVEKVYDSDRKNLVTWNCWLPSSRVYECYESYSTETRSFPRLESLGHFGKKGKIKGRLTMNMKLLIVIVLLVVGWGVFSVVQKFRSQGLGAMVYSGAVAPVGMAVAGPTGVAPVAGPTVPAAFPGPSLPAGPGGVAAMSRLERFGVMRAGGRTVAVGEDGAWYESGRMCADGLVTAIRADVILIKREGGELWIFQK